MQFLSRQSCNLKIARVNQVRFSVRFIAAISQGFRACLKLDATKIASSCRDKNRPCKRALRTPQFKNMACFLKFQVSNNWLNVKVRLNSFHLNGQTLRFHSPTLKVGIALYSIINSTT